MEMKPWSKGVRLPKSPPSSMRFTWMRWGNEGYSIRLRQHTFSNAFFPKCRNRLTHSSAIIQCSEHWQAASLTLFRLPYLARLSFVMRLKIFRERGFPVYEAINLARCRYCLLWWALLWVVLRPKIHNVSVFLLLWFKPTERYWLVSNTHYFQNLWWEAYTSSYWCKFLSSISRWHSSCSKTMIPSGK